MPQLPRLQLPGQLVAWAAQLVDALETTEPWREVGATGQPAFQGTWVNFGGSAEPLRFLKDALGWVHVFGRAKSGTSGTVVFTLPDGYKPSHAIFFPGLVAGAPAGSFVEIQADGDVLATGSTTTDVHFNFHFRAA